MALVMLPCDLPWWPTLQRHLTKLLNIKHTIELVEGMMKIYELCNISLDPDDDEIKDPDLFIGLLNFLDNDLTSDERSNFLSKTLPNIVNRALKLKQWKPGGGFHFSLQQQEESIEINYQFISSLLAHCFFSTYPRRTEKTHPTLQDFNFSYFFKNLHNPAQKAKLKSILYYFDWIDSNSSDGSLKVCRQVMSSKEWLTIEDWLECSLPLCNLQIKHEGKLERSNSDYLHICFCSSRIGGGVLSDGATQECVSFITYPELLTVLLNVEALEDNEVLTIERLRHTARINDPKNKACLEKIDNPQEVTICCMDPEDYKKFPITQYEEDNILRELNKCLLGFQQKHIRNAPIQKLQHKSNLRRLSPIGESVSSTPPELNANIIVTQASLDSRKSSVGPNPSEQKQFLMKPTLATSIPNRNTNLNSSDAANSRRGRFIVLGSSGECLPVNRRPMDQYSSCSSSEDEFHSAKQSLDEDDDVDYNQRYSMELDTPERRNTFAQRLRDALRRETQSSTDESSYAVGISVAGSELCDGDIKLRRGGSRGFMLKEEKDSLDEQITYDTFKNKHPLNRTDTGNSSKYSFSTEYSSELEELYEQFSKWLDDPILDESKRELDARDLAVVRFAGSLLKRTLSESFAGMPLTADGEHPIECSKQTEQIINKNRLILSARSLSLELARQNHKLAAQLIENNFSETKPPKNWTIKCEIEPVVQILDEITVTLRPPKKRNKKISQLTSKSSSDLKPISSGNWGCGSSHCGDVQLKVILQWLAASVSGVSALVYHTACHPQLATLDTLVRILVDRKWTVKDLVHEMLLYSTNYLHGKLQQSTATLFEDLIGVERTE